MSGTPAPSQPGRIVTETFDGRFLAPDAVHRSMRGLEERLVTRFTERRRREAEYAARMGQFHAPLRELITKGEKTSDSPSAMRRLHALARARKARRPASEAVRDGGGMASVPAYDYEWAWSARCGTPAEHMQTAERATGELAIEMWTGLDDARSGVSARAAVGTYVAPPAADATLCVRSSPAFTNAWGNWCMYDAASSDGRLGLYVERYDLDGNPAGAVVDQQVSIWSDSSWWAGVGAQEGSHACFELLSAPIAVDPHHQYVIWVWCGADVSASGWGTFSGSGAGASLRVSVPTITWELSSQGL